MYIKKGAYSFGQQVIQQQKRIKDFYVKLRDLMFKE